MKAGRIGWIVLGWIAVGWSVCVVPVRAELLGAWSKTNSTTAPVSYPAFTNHPNLDGPATMNWKPRFNTYTDNAWFFIEPWFCSNVATVVNGVTNRFTGQATLFPGISATNQFTYTTISGPLLTISNYIEFALTAKPGYKVVVTQMLHRMLNDERRLLFHLRSDADDYTGEMFEKTTGTSGSGPLHQAFLTTNQLQWTTNFFVLYTNVVSSRAATDYDRTTLKLRLYGVNSSSKWVYAYWTNMGVHAQNSVYSNAMIAFEGRVEPLGNIFPRKGPLAGGTFVMVTNAFDVATITIGSGVDITNVTVGGKTVTAVHGQGTNWVSFTVPPGDGPGAVDIAVYSASKGLNLMTSSFIYNPTGVIVSVSPTSGVSGTMVTITGEHLGDGTDITNVTLGATTASIVSQSATQIVITAPAGSGVVDLHTDSTSYGAASLVGAFTYESSAPADQTISSFLPADGSSFEADGVAALSATASSGLAVTFAVADGPGVITGGTNLSFSGAGSVFVVASQAGSAEWNPAPPVTNQYRVYALSVSSGPYAGGNTITITNGHFGAITNVTVGGVAATIHSSGASWVTITIPAVGASGAQDIVVQTSDHGEITLAGAYTVNPAGEIGGATTIIKWSAVADVLVPGQATAKGSQNTIYGVDYFGNTLYAAGSFTNIGGSNCYRVAQYDGTNWSSMGSGVARIANVNYIRGADHGIYAGGYFTNIGGVNMLGVGRWDGTNWNAMGRVPTAGTDPENRRGLGFSPFVNGYVNWIEPYKDNTMIAGGYFTNTDYQVSGVNYLAKYDGVGWTNMQEGFRNVILTAAYDRDRDHLYVGGSFTNHIPTNTSVHLNYITRWNGTHWTNMAHGLGSRVTCMAVHPTSGELYIGGWFTNYTDNVGNKYPANNVAKWDPVSQSFTNVGSGFNNWVYTLKFAPDGTLYAGGMFTNTYITTEPDKTASQLVTRRIAMWNGTHWTNMGGGFNDAVNALTVNTNNNDLYAGGFFKIAYQDDDTSTNTWYVAKYGAVETPAAGVEPSTGSVTGGFEVVITGRDLGSGSDITNVTICGASVASIVSQSATQVVVVAGGGDPGLGDVRVFSASFGESVAGNAFTYTGSSFVLLGTNGAAIANGAVAASAAGTHFGEVLNGVTVTNVFSITNAGNATLNLSWTTNGSVAFSVVAGPATVDAGAAEDFVVAYVSDGLAATATVEIVHDAMLSPFLLNLASDTSIQPQTITFPAIADQVTTSAVGLAATASSGLTVTFAVGSGPATLAGDTNLTFTGAGEVSIVASQAGDASYEAAPDVTNTFNVTKAVAGVFLSGLSHRYDGAAHSVTVTTDPAGLTLSVTYDGLSWAPTNAGTYAVTALVSDVSYQGSATGSLLIKPAITQVLFAANVDLNRIETYDAATGTQINDALVTNVTSMWGITVVSNRLFVSSLNGTDNVRAYDARTGDYLFDLPGSRMGIDVAVVGATVYVSIYNQGVRSYDLTTGTAINTSLVNSSYSAGQGFAVSTSRIYTAMNGDAVVRRWDALSGSLLDATFAGTLSNPTDVELDGDLMYVAAGGVSLGRKVGLYDALDGSVINDALVIQDGMRYIAAAEGALYVSSAGASVGVGAYEADSGAAVAGFTVITGNFNGVCSATLTPKAEQTITFPTIDGQLTTDTVGLAATASSGLPVTFMTNGGPAVIAGGTNLSFTGAGLVSIVALQAGDTDWSAASSVTNLIHVYAFSANSGPYAGGNTITITNGNFGTITNVLVGGVMATITGSGANWFTITLPAASGAGAVDIVVQTSDNGDITLPGAYTYNPAGEIGGMVYLPSAWTNLGRGMSSDVAALALDGMNLYAGGQFAAADEMSVNSVAKWNGASWTNLASGMNNTVLALTHDGTNLYAGGGFTTAGGRVANYVAKWNGTSWTNLGSGMNGSVFALVHDGTNLYAGGQFTTAGGLSANNVAKWNGTSWTNLGSGMNGRVSAMVIDGANLYAGGQFTNAGGVAARRMAKWDGTSWTNLGSGVNSYVTTLEHDGSNLYAGGYFTNAGGVAANYVAKWDLASGAWTNMGSGVSSLVFALAHDGTNLYVGGYFTTAGGLSANNAAKWNGTSWTNMGSGMSGGVNVLAHDGTNLYAGGAFTSAGGVVANRAAKWGSSIIETSGIEPSSGSWTGGYEVVISGTNLCDGTDATNVTLCGVSATIQSQSATQIVVVAGVGDPGLGDVRVFSTSFGETVKSNSFTYLEPEFAMEGEGLDIANGETARVETGADFAATRVGVSRTSRFQIRNPGNEVLTISAFVTNGAAAEMFEVSDESRRRSPVGGGGIPSQLDPGDSADFLLAYTPTAAGAHSAALVLTHDGPDSPFVLNLAGMGFDVSVDQGPLAGGNTITITGGSFGTITNVLVGGVPATFVQTETNEFTVTLPPAGVEGAVDIVVQTSDLGEIALVEAYAYNPPGQIGFEGMVCGWEELAGLPLPTYYLEAGSLQGSLYAVGGARIVSGYSFQSVTNVFRWDGMTWTEMEGLPGAASFLGVATYRDRLYALGGSDGVGARTNVYRFDGASWTEVEGLPAGRSQVAAAVWEDALYCLGGGTNVYRYNGTNWTEVASLPEPMEAATASAWDGKLYAIGGVGDGSGLTSVYAYDGSGWTAAASLPVPMAYASSGVLDGGLHVWAGAHFGDGLTNVYRFNGARWQAEGALPNGRFAVGGAVHDGALYAVAGFGPDENGAGQTTNVYRSIACDLPGVEPSMGTWTGGYEVVIRGVNLGDGSDITNVTLCGIQATILSQAVDRVWVTAGAAPSAGLGDVRVFSTSFGETVKSNAFEYLKSNQTISDFLPANGSKFLSNAVTGLSAFASSGLDVTFAVTIGPGTINGLTNLSFTGGGVVTVVASQAGDGLWNPASDVTNTYNVCELSDSEGPFAGGNTLTITNGYFGAITNVTVGGVAATILDSGTSWVTILVPSVGVSGPADVVVQTESDGEVVLPAAYTVSTRAQDLPLGAVVYDDSWTWDGSPLGWRVVDTNYGGAAGLVTLQATNRIVNRAYQDGAWANQWGTCTLRTWLNSTNFHGDFSPAFSGAVVRTRVPWTTFNQDGMFVSGISTDSVFIASRTELGGDEWSDEGAVLDWFTDPGTSAARRSDLSPSSMNYWTRSGMRTMWSGQYYNLAAYYVSVPGGAIAYGPWTGDALSVVPVVNVGGAVEFTIQPDGRYRLYAGPLDQTITFPDPGTAQITTNSVTLAASATSGQDVTFSIFSGHGSLNGNILTFTGAGDVLVVASQEGNAYWNPAPAITNALTVTKATATVTLTNLTQTYDGTVRAVTSQTDPADLDVVVTYDGVTNAPVNAGSYTVTGRVDDVMYAGESVATLTINKADQTIDFPAIAGQLTTNIVGLAATASSGFDVSFAVTAGPGSISGGTNLSFSGTGTVSIMASQVGDTNWNAAVPVTNTFEVTKAVATMTLTNLTQTYDGSARVVTAETVPAGLAVDLTYDGSATAPTGAGSYAVTGTVNDVMYQGEAVGTLVVAKANQTIDFAALGDSFWTNQLGLAATASSTLTVSFTVSSGPATITGATNLTFDGYGEVVLVANQSGDDNFNAAPTVTNTFNALGPIMAISGTTDFGSALIGLETVTNIFTVTNAGTGRLTLSGIATNGSQAGSFRIEPSTFNLEPSTATNVAIIFAPQSGAANNASFVFTFNGTNSPYTLNVSGSGIGGGIALETNRLTFASIYAGTNPPVQQIMMTNVGVSGFSYSNALPDAWVSVTPVTGSVATAGSVSLNFDVNASILHAGIYSATNLINSLDATNAPQTIVIELTVAKAPQGIDFPAIADQLTTNLVVLSATSTSGLPVSFEVVSGPASISGDTNLSFTASGEVAIRASQAGNSNWLAAASVTNTFTVNKTPQAALVFTPSSPQVFGTSQGLSTTGGSGTGDVSFTVNSGVGQITGLTNLLATSGTGEIVVEATKATDDMYLVTSTIGTVTVAKADQAIDFAAIGDQFWTNRLGLAATASSTLTVNFAVSSGPATITGATNLSFNGYGEVVLLANQFGDANYNAAPTVTNTFNALGPIMAISGATDFGSALIGMETVTNLFTVTNAGSAQLTIASVITNGAHASSFMLNLTSSVISASSAVQIPVIFDPRSGESNTASFVFTFDGTNSPYTVEVTGFGYGGDIALSSNTLNFAATYVGADPSAQTLVLTNAGFSAINWTNVIAYSADASGWLTLAPSSGNLAKQSGIELTATIAATNLNAGTYYATNTVIAPEATNSPQSFVVELVIAKADQVITNFLPENDENFVFGSSTTISAQASSGLPVSFTNLTPDIALLAGTSISFTNPGIAQVQASQAGNSNWNAATSITHSWRVGGLITNVTPQVANVGGGIEVTVQGIWLGDGSNITTVSLAGVQATILTQTIHEVTVRAGIAPATVTGDVNVVSATGGFMVLSNAFEYLWLDAPEQLDPVDVTTTDLVARWLTVSNATTHYLEAALDTNFITHVPGYEQVDVAMATQYPVTGLDAATWYALRIFAWNTNGYSWPSRTVWVPTTTNTPYEFHPPPSGPASAGAVMERDLSIIFMGTNFIYTADSSDTNVVMASINGGKLVLDPRNPGTATITVTATDPRTGYTATYQFTMTVVGNPLLTSSVMQPRESWNPRFTQSITVRNTSGMDALGVRVLFTNLMPGITVENATGTSVDGRPMIEMEMPFPNGGFLNLNLVYLCTGAYRVDRYPATLEFQYILPEWVRPLPGEGVAIGGVLISGQRMVLEFGSTVGLLYGIEYMNNFPTGTWQVVPLRLRATANRTQWIDAGPPATLPPEGVRIYRVKELAE